MKTGTDTFRTCTCSLVISACILLTTPASARECQHDLAKTSAVVSYAVDGDTIVLTTNQRVRIIGLDTLEMDAKDPEDRHWAIQATNALDKLVTGKSVTLLSGQDRKDRYDRLLAHVKLPDGQDVAKQLIQQGLGIAVGVGRNTACAESNRTLENIARSQQRGIWKNKGRWWSNGESRLTAKRGFHVIRSTVSERFDAGQKTRLQLANGLYVKLGRHWPLDAVQTNALFAETDKQIVEVRGWIGGRLPTPELSLHHPANIQIVAQ